MDYAGGPAGLTGSRSGTCPVCGWTGPGRDAPFHECDQGWLRGAATWVPDIDSVPPATAEDWLRVAPEDRHPEGGFEPSTFGALDTAHEHADEGPVRD